ncbi:Ger(x)C family spore germination protein [Bacillus sp. 3255]|uniref:Ger(x)C family spore germination protein n=1 Tax=Bacillus sp. 3255 TaxID=2817904 RepID=UPI002864D177|nr:Ger(x)C family spore germination protein [Bacillus sp. 3255]MDR6880711.1 spore germination protein KC [Bacillus sp. 3255]
MKSCIAGMTCLSLLFLLTGCWNKAELTEFGFVQAVAVDLSKEGKIELTTHFYLPSGGEAVSNTPPRQRGVSIQTVGDTAFEAVRDIPIHFGRKAKWDHFRAILFGEEFAKEKGITEVMDYFMRDHEPRETVFVLIAKGPAKEVLNIKPFIESTIGQQIRRMVDSAAHYSAKTTRVPLLDLANQLKSETGVAMLPLIQINNKPNIASVAGIAAIKDEKMTNQFMTPADVESLLMMLNKYQSGVIEYPCGEPENNIHEALEVIALNGKVTPQVKGDKVLSRVSIKIKGSLGEIRCSPMATKEDGRRLEQRISDYVENNLRKTITDLQKAKLDLIGIGNKIYRKDPAVWFKLKPDWEEHFAKSRFDIQVKVQVTNSGQDAGKPFSKE